jgi:hypothetical protein
VLDHVAGELPEGLKGRTDLRCFSIMNASPDTVEQRPERREVESVRASVETGPEPGSPTLEYGASGFLPEADRAGFERRAAPFAGQEASPEQPD